MGMVGVKKVNLHTLEEAYNDTLCLFQASSSLFEMPQSGIIGG
jgi:hypothetical protein